MHHILGNIEISDLGHPLKYFEDRHIFLDSRNPIKIHQSAMLGYGIRILTTSHVPAHWERLTQRPVTIGHECFIGSFSVLYNCDIGSHAIVSIGSVVASRDVPPFTIVEGNPARIIATYNNTHKKWIYMDKPLELKRRGTCRGSGQGQ